MAPNTTPFSNTQFQGWASFYGGNVQAPQAPPPSAFGSAALGQPPSNGQYTGGWAFPNAWANFYEGKQGFQAPQNQNSPAGALAATYYQQGISHPANDPNLLGWEQDFGNPQTILQQDQNWAQSLGAAPTGQTPTGGWVNPEAWAAYYGGTNGFTAPQNAGSPASALAAASQIAATSNPQNNPGLLGWVQDFGQPGSILANTPNWAASLGAPQVNAQGQGVGQTNTQGWTSPLAWAAYYGGFQGYPQPVDNTLQAAQNWEGVTNANDPSLLGWELDYGNPQTVVSTIQASPQYRAYQAAVTAENNALYWQQVYNNEAYSNALNASQAASQTAAYNQAVAANNAAIAAANAAAAAAQQQGPVSAPGSSNPYVVANTPYSSGSYGAQFSAQNQPTTFGAPTNAFSTTGFNPVSVYGPSAPQYFTLQPTNITGTGQALTSGGFQVNATTPPEVLGPGVPHSEVQFYQGQLNNQALQQAAQQAASRNPKPQGPTVGGPASVGGTQPPVYEGTPGTFNLAYDYPTLAAQYAKEFGSYGQFALGVPGTSPFNTGGGPFGLIPPGTFTTPDLNELLGIESTFAQYTPEIASPGYDYVPPIGTDYYPNVDDFGRPIPDVGPPQPFSMPDFGGLVTQDLPPLQLPASWTNPIATPPAPSINVPDIALPENLQSPGITVSPATETPQEAPQPAPINLALESGLVNPVNVDGFGPLTPSSLTLGQSVPFLSPEDLTPLNSSPFGSAPADVFTDPGLGAESLYQGGYGQPVQDQLPPPQPFSNAEQFVGKYGTSTTLRQVLNDASPEMLRGNSLSTVLWALGSGVDTPIDLTNPNFLDQIKAAIDAGGGWGGDQVVAGLKGAMRGGPQAIVDAAQDVQQDRQEGPGAYGSLGYTTEPVYGTPQPFAPPPSPPMAATPHPVPPAEIPYDVGQGYGGGFQEAPPQAMQTGYSYPSGSFSGPQPTQAGYSYPAGSFGEVPYPDLLPAIPSTQAGYSYLSGTFGEIDPYNFSAASYPAGGYGGGTTVTPDLGEQLGLGHIPDMPVKFSDFPDAETPLDIGALFPSFDWTKIGSPPSQNIQDERPIQAGYSYLPGTFGEIDPYNFSSAPYPAGGYGGGDATELPSAQTSSQYGQPVPEEETLLPQAAPEVAPQEAPPDPVTEAALGEMGTGTGPIGTALSRGVPKDVLDNAAAYVQSGKNTAQLQQMMAASGFPQNANWCADFASVIQTGMGNALPQGPALASNWQTWGAPGDETNPQPGDILSRMNVNPGEGGGLQYGHIMTVQSYDPQTDMVTTVEGNPAKVATRDRESLLTDYELRSPGPPAPTPVNYPVQQNYTPVPQGQDWSNQAPGPMFSGANSVDLTHGMYPVGTTRGQPDYQVFSGSPEYNTVYSPHNTTYFGDVGGYTDPGNPGAYNLAINQGQQGYNTNFGGVSLPWDVSGTQNNIALVQGPNGEFQYLPIVDKGPNQTARSQGELDILSASLPGFGYTRGTMPGAGWKFQMINPQGPFGGPPNLLGR